MSTQSFRRNFRARRSFSRFFSPAIAPTTAFLLWCGSNLNDFEFQTQTNMEHPMPYVQKPDLEAWGFLKIPCSNWKLIWHKHIHQILGRYSMIFLNFYLKFWVRIPQHKMFLQIFLNLLRKMENISLLNHKDISYIWLCRNHLAPIFSNHIVNLIVLLIAKCFK